MRATRLSILLLLIACRGADGVKRSAGERPSRYGLGRTPTPAEIAALDIDANASGVGLPVGQGTAATGAVIYAQKCMSCHGSRGEGFEKNPTLIGQAPPPGFVFATDFKAPKTIGNYWPYASTLYDYMHRAMPMNAPGSLTPDETYSLTAFLLAENGIISPTTTIDAQSLAGIKMPARAYLVPDNRTGGKVVR